MLPTHTRYRHLVISVIDRLVMGLAYHYYVPLFTNTETIRQLSLFKTGWDLPIEY